MASKMSDAWYRTQAQKLVDTDETVEVDSSAAVVRNNNRHARPGAYVRAWIWVDDPDTDAGSLE